mmetsp:Transcript_26889/g.37529  ORF Transcript_26889/g.37529 Transcript_26889/m.37529 type:complete len:350 (+) Transcript_26889:106-1155(+)
MDIIATTDFLRCVRCYSITVFFDGRAILRLKGSNTPLTRIGKLLTNPELGLREVIPTPLASDADVALHADLHAGFRIALALVRGAADPLLGIDEAHARHQQEVLQVVDLILRLRQTLEALAHLPRAVPAVEQHLRLGGGAERFGLPSGFKDLVHVVAQEPRQPDVRVRRLVAGKLGDAPAVLEDGGGGGGARLPLLLGQVEVEVLGEVRQDGGEGPREGVEDHLEHRLAGAAAGVGELRDVEAVLRRVEVEVGQVGDAEAREGLDGVGEVVLVVGLLHLLHRFGEAREDVAVDRGEVLHLDRVLLLVVVVEVPDDVAHGVAQLPIRIRHLLDDPVPDGHVAAEVHGGGP